MVIMINNQENGHDTRGITPPSDLLSSNEAKNKKRRSLSESSLQKLQTSHMESMEADYHLNNISRAGNHLKQLSRADSYLHRADRTKLSPVLNDNDDNKPTTNSGAPSSSMKNVDNKFKSSEIRYNEFSTAGVPLFEIIRKLEEEKIINREDRLALNRALNDSERREYVIISIQDIELSSNVRFAVRRLKMLIHQNPAGMAISGSSPAILSSQQHKHTDISSKHLGAILPLNTSQIPSYDQGNQQENQMTILPFTPRDVEFIGNSSTKEISPYRSPKARRKMEEPFFDGNLAGQMGFSSSPRLGLELGFELDLGLKLGLGLRLG
jgi:hypothetical protein